MADAGRILAELRERSTRRYVAAFDIALLEHAIGHVDDALREMERAGRERSVWMLWAGVDPLLDVMRADSRFAALFARPGASAT